MVTVDRYTYLFESYMKGESLDKVWSGLNEEQKDSLQNQLNIMIERLRDLSRPEGYPLGGVLREGCKDSRRQNRICQTPPFTTLPEFEDFIFSDAHFGKFCLDQLPPADATYEDYVRYCLYPW